MISGTVPTAHVTEVLFTNQKVIVPIDVVVKKTDNAPNSTNYLAGAVFELEYRQDSEGSWQKAAVVDDLTIPEIDAQSRFSVPKTGIKLTGLLDGQYRLREISPPTGYIIISAEPVVFTVSDGAIGSTEGTDSTVTYNAGSETDDAEFIIPNTPGSPLPNAGGPGTRLFTILESILMAGSVLLLWRRRRLI